MKIVFASNNQNKILEIKNMLPKSIEILSLNDIGCTEDIPETATTIEGNAILKANYVTEKFGYDCFADDTGLEIEALNGAPGVYSARYSGEEKNAEANMNKVLSELTGIENRKAQFKTVMALNLNGKSQLFIGIVTGNITNEKIGNLGFGYDPIFQPEGDTRTFAELSMEEKNQNSHRSKALKQLVEFLNITDK